MATTEAVNPETTVSHLYLVYSLAREGEPALL